MGDKYIIGIDPDSKKHGVALYLNGHLESLYSFNLMELQEFILEGFEGELDGLEIHIEDNVAVSAAYGARDSNRNQNVKLKMAQHIGMCKQAQVEVERLTEHYGVKLVKHKQSKSWKNAAGKKQFEKVTGWDGRSNEDTRSAAYFGYLGAV